MNEPTDLIDPDTQKLERELFFSYQLTDKQSVGVATYIQGLIQAARVDEIEAFAEAVKDYALENLEYSVSVAIAVDHILTQWSDR